MTPSPVVLVVDGHDIQVRASVLADPARHIARLLRSLMVEYAPSHAVIVLPVHGDDRNNALLAAVSLIPLGMVYSGLGRTHPDQIADAVFAVQKAGGSCVLVSGNRHLAQLVGTDVTLRWPFATDLLDAAAVKATFGVTPHQIPDLFSLAGEKHQGIGMIPARELLREHGTLKRICDVADTLTNKIGHRLRANLEVILDASKLIDVSPNRLPFPLAAIEVIGSLLLPDGLMDADPNENEPDAVVDVPLQTLNSDAAIHSFLDHVAASTEISVFIDHNDSGGLHGMGMSLVDGSTWYVRADQAEAMKAVASAFCDVSKVKIGYDFRAMLPILSTAHIGTEGPFRDLKLLAHVIDSSHQEADLIELCRKRLRCRISSRKPRADTGQWAGHLAAAALQLYGSMTRVLFCGSEVRRHYEEVECALIPILNKMNEFGVRVDVDLASTLQLTSVNSNGKGDLSEVGARLIEDPGSGMPSDNIESFESYFDEDTPECPVSNIEHLRVHIRPVTGRVHPSCSHGNSLTGRINTSAPNLQGLKKSLRNHIVAGPGCSLLALDYSQIDLRVLAHLSGDEALCKAFHADQDVHQATAADLFGVDIRFVTDEQRCAAKSVNFGIVYGITAKGLAKVIGCSIDDATELLRKFLTQYPGVKKFHHEAVQFARSHGFAETAAGRRRFISWIRTCNAPRLEKAKRQAIHTPVQGFAADIFKRAMVDVDGWLRVEAPEVNIILPIHDELLLEGPSELVARVANDVARIMCSAARMAVPLVVEYDIGSSWADAQRGKQRATSYQSNLPAITAPSP